MATTGGKVTAQAQGSGPLNVKVKTRIVYNNTPSVIATIRTGGQASSYAVSRKIIAEARQRAPVRTGRLRDSIDAEPVHPGYNVFVGAAYGAFVEYGTRRMRAQPFFRPAIEACRSYFINETAKNCSSFTHR